MQHMIGDRPTSTPLYPTREAALSEAIVKVERLKKYLSAERISFINEYPRTAHVGVKFGTIENIHTGVVRNWESKCADVHASLREVTNLIADSAVQPKQRANVPMA